MELRIINTNGTAPYGINEIMHSEPVDSLNQAESRLNAWVEANCREGSTAPKGVVVDTDEDGDETTYDAATGELM